MLPKLDKKIASQLCLVPDHTWLLVIILLATALRLFHLGEQSLWRTEAWSLVFASMPLKTSIESILIDGVHPPLYYLVLRLFLYMGQSEEIARLPSAIFGILAIPLAYKISRLCFDQRIGSVSALLLSLSPFHLWYSQEARMYTMVMFFALGSIYFFLRAIRENTLRSWAGLVIFSTLAYGTHYFALQIALVQFAFILCRFQTLHRVFRKWAICQGLAFLPLIPWLIAYFSQDVVALGIGWITRPTFLAPLQTLWTFSSNYRGSLTPIGLLLIGLLLLHGFLTRQPTHRDHKLFLALWLGLPIMATWLISQRRPIYAHRYLIVVLPAYLVLLAYGVVSVSHRFLKWALAVALVAIMASSSIRIYRDPVFLKEDWGGVLTYIESRFETSDLIVLRESEIVAPLVYYGQRGQPFVVLDREAGPNPLQRLVSEYPRLWLICRGPCAPLASDDWAASPLYSDCDLQTGEWLNAHRDRVMEEKDFSGVHVLLVRGSP